MQSLRSPALQILELPPHELAAILSLERKPDFDFPSVLSQGVGSDQRITGVVALSGEHNALAGFWEKLRDCLRHTGACLVHQRFDLYSPRKSSLFRGSHLPRSQNWQIQSGPLDLVGRSFF